MGGLGIVLGSSLAMVTINFSYLKNEKVIAFFTVLFCFGLIGFVDDFLKIKKKNAKGLSPFLRITFEVLVVMAVLRYLRFDKENMWLIKIPFYQVVSFGGLFLPLVIFMIVGTSNAVNMTDGLDGLAAGLVFMALTPFIVLLIDEGNFNCALCMLSISGAIAGFITYNFHPAKIFMGDVGSLPLGAILGYCALLVKGEVVLVIAGGIFVVETLSVIMQVLYFKVIHKRIFKMAPLHHHFEMSGVKEWKVVMIFYAIGYLLSFIAILMGVI